MEFKILKSERVFAGRIFAVEQHLVALPDGRQAQVDLVQHGDAITILPVDHDGSIWFIRQYRHPTRRWLLELPAGHLEDAESPEIAANRELREEIGMSAQNITRLGGFFLAPGYSTEYLHVYLATGLSPDPLEPDEDEMIEIVKISITKAYKLAEDGAIEDAKSLAALLLARQQLIAGE